jgi:UDP-N-acetylmuramoylalanine--D-glutamate ligase
MSSFLQDQHVLILGLGLSGLSMAKWCVRLGAKVTVLDSRKAPPELAQLQIDCPRVTFRTGHFTSDQIAGTTIQAVFKSPGLSPAITQDLIQTAKASGLMVGNELSLFNQALRDLKQFQSYNPKVIGITGTNGKTTVTALTGLLVERAGLTVAVAGNIGPALLTTLANRLDDQNLPQVWVLELSSFQLDSVHDFEPTAATVLNLTEDHLDWHGDMAAYASAKQNVYGFANGRSLKEKTQIHVNHLVPTAVDHYGIEVVAGMKWLVRAVPLSDEPAAKVKKGELPAAQPFTLQRLLPADALRIRGQHNATNALAALSLACKVGCSLAPTLYGLREYKGEPHRMQMIRILNGVTFIDDSKGTNVGATVAALDSLGAEMPDATHAAASDSVTNRKKIIAILGGDGKGQDFSPLLAPVSQFVSGVVLIGRDAPQIKALLASVSVDIQQAASLEEAVVTAYQLARRIGTSSTVLLSPACASLDMFRNYEHRAQVFVQTVETLVEDEGLAS